MIVVVIASVFSSSFFASFCVFNPASTWVSGLSICLAGLMFCVGRSTIDDRQSGCTE
jgi:hypothetical protein